MSRDAVSWKAVLPWPPSVNHYYTVVRGRKILSPEGRRYGESAALACIAQDRPERPFSGSLRVEVLASPPDRRRRDLDNLLKPLLDALTVGGVLEDDGMIDDLRITRRPVVSGGRVEVVVAVI